MDLEKDDVRNFEAAAQCGNSRKVPDFGLSRDAERPVASFGSVVEKGKVEEKIASSGDPGLIFHESRCIFRTLKAEKKKAAVNIT